MRTINSCFFSPPTRLVVVVGMAALHAMMATSASAALIYDPVVVVTSGTTSSTVGVTTSISIYNEGVANQVAPISTTAHNSGVAGTRLVTAGGQHSDGRLANNPGVADAAAVGVLYVGEQYVYNAGYDRPTGTANVSTNATNAPRSFGRTSVTQNVASGATVLQTHPQGVTYFNGSIRGAVGDDTGTAKYTAGASPGTSIATRSSGGWRDYNTNTILSPTVPPTGGLHDVRSVELLGGNLFGASGVLAATTRGIYRIDPTAATAPAMYIPTGQSSNPVEFALFDDPNLAVSLNLGYDTAYIADVTTANGGIQKWTWNGAAWSLAYTMRDTGLNNYFGLAGQLDAATNQITLFATVVDAASTKLQQVTDTGALSSFTTLASLNLSSGQIFHGVALSAIPEPGSAVILGGLLSILGLQRRSRRK